MQMFRGNKSETSAFLLKNNCYRYGYIYDFHTYDCYEYFCY